MIFHFYDFLMFGFGFITIFLGCVFLAYGITALQKDDPVLSVLLAELRDYESPLECKFKKAKGPSITSVEMQVDRSKRKGSKQSLQSLEVKIAELLDEILLAKDHNPDMVETLSTTLLGYYAQYGCAVYRERFSSKNTDSGVDRVKALIPENDTYGEPKELLHMIADYIEALHRRIAEREGDKIRCDDRPVL